MKKFLFLAMAAAAMVSCSQNEEIENAAQKAEIKLGTVVSNTTRAAVTDNESLKDEGFTVYAYKTEATDMDKLAAGGLGTAYMDGAKATYKDNVWSLSGSYYWPKTGKVQFFAYSTYATNPAIYELKADAIYPTLTYTVAKEAADQKDLVVATAFNKTYQTTALQLDFTHALTQINFSAVGSNADFTYKLTSIVIEGVYGKGTYDFAPGAGPWTTTGTADATYTYPISADNSQVSISGTTEQKLDQTNGALMLIPQAMSETAVIKVKYDVYEGDALLNNIDTTIELKDKTTWSAGANLRYTLTLSGTGASIDLTPNVGGWASETPGN